MNKIIMILILLSFLLTPQALAQDELDYNYNSTKSIPIELIIARQISTKEEIKEGDYLKFYATKTVKYEGKEIVKKGQLINGRIETIITSGMNGFPAEIYIKFEIPGINESKLLNLYTKEGQNRCFWVYPLKWSLTLIPFVGSLTNLIKGGHAIIKPSELITIQYYPEW